MRRILRPVALAVLVAVSLWFLQQRDDGDPAAGPPTSPPASSVTPVPASPPAPGASVTDAGEQGEPGGIPVDPTAAAIPRDQAQADRFATYEQAAAEFLADFARPAPTVPEGQWWSKVAPHLSAAADEAYRGTDPQMVPFTQVTGQAVILPSDAPSDLLMLARVPTNAGYYRVEMETDAAGIRVTRATPEVAEGQW